MQNAPRWSILQYFRPSLSYHLSLRSLFSIFSGRLTHVLLYIKFGRNPPSGSLDNVYKRHFNQILTVQNTGVTFKKVNVTQILSSNNISMQAWSKSTRMFRRQSAGKNLHGRERWMTISDAAPYGLIKIYIICLCLTKRTICIICQLISYAMTTRVKSSINYTHIIEKKCTLCCFQGLSDPRFLPINI